MKKKLKLPLIITVITLIVIGIMYSTLNTTNKNSKLYTKTDFNTFIKSVNESRNSVRNSVTSIKSNYTDWIKDDICPFNNDELLSMREYNNSVNVLDTNFNKKFDKNKELTYDEAKKDIDQLFNLFKYTYGAYGYFGGDSKFSEVKSDMINALPKDKTVLMSQFEDILNSNLSFLKDYHFRILENSIGPICKGQYYYMNDEPIYKDSAGFYLIIKSVKYYIKSIDGNNNIDKFLTYAISDTGDIVYNIAILKDFTGTNQITCELKLKPSNSNKEISKDLVLNATINSYTSNYNTMYKYTEDKGIPIISLSSFTKKDSSDDKSVYDFINSAYTARKSPAAILDLRGNFGGDISIAMSWINSYLGITKNNVDFSSYPFLRGSYSNLQSSVISSINQTNYNEEFLNCSGHASKSFKTDNILFVLMDKNTASASETLIEALTNADNVITVGTNSAGALLSLDEKYYKLNNSSLAIQMGSMLYLTPLGDEFEECGFKPDLLVNPCNALDRTIKLIENYKLKETQH